MHKIVQIAMACYMEMYIWCHQMKQVDPKKSTTYHLILSILPNERHKE